MLPPIMSIALTMPEEVVLLTLDDETGRPLGVPDQAVSLALVGAVLMELALAGRLDSDIDRLFVENSAPTGDPVLDGILARVSAGPEGQDSRWWMGHLAPQGASLRQALLDRLVQRGVLRLDKGRRLLLLPDRRYPKADGSAMNATRARLRAVLLEGEIPEARDTLMAGLCSATGLLPVILSETEAEAAAPRLAAVAGLEEMSRSLVAETRDRLAAGH
ncbi:GPP34 family phosphoprotein [Roseomonas sp. SSH11]|uniref:GPP34 family phosphoprotein n=1 Tax=Pararoseomonas baculiformis TaxID=2820812 RepID=A0ABS4AG68_9PROT|nr:GPP34 family phosphoprotein [Pararoseomonas baculiformis]MBP0445209.1 GPP34 family phosphoprotein [Pararoseomonas baculiformis]